MLRTRLALLCRLSAIVALLLVGPVAADESAKTGTILGRVRTFAGDPIPNAKVRLCTQRRPSTPLVTVTSDQSGAFRFDDAPADALYDIWAEAPGFARDLIKRLTVHPQTSTDVGEIILVPGTEIIGRVLDSSGRASAGLKVEFRHFHRYKGRTVYPSDVPAYSATDNDGRFRIRDVPLGIYNLTIRPETLAHAERFGDIDGSNPILDLGDIQLVADQPIKGVVLDDAGSPVPDAEVWMEIDDQRKALSDAQGRFEIRGFDELPKIGHIRAQKRGYVFHQQKPAGGESQKIALQRSAIVSGRAVDSVTGDPINIKQIVMCEYFKDESGEAVIRGCRSMQFDQPSPGAFVSYREWPGIFRLTVTAEGYHPYEELLGELTGMEPLEGIEVKMLPKTVKPHTTFKPAAITGRITHRGKPVSNAWVALWWPIGENDRVNVDIERGRCVPNRWPRTESVLVEADGSFAVTIPEPSDSYMISVEAPGMSPTLHGPLALSASASAKSDIELVQGGTISGRVDGIPEHYRNSAWVVAFQRGPWRSECRVAPDGTFRLDNLPAGEWGLKVGSDGYRDTEVPNRGLNGIPAHYYEEKATPWEAAVGVTLPAGESVTDIVLHWQAE